MAERKGTVVVTGASAGIGRELARVFVERGWDAVLVARRRERLEEIAGELERSSGRSVVPLPCDLLADDADRRLLDGLAERDLDVDVLVNNAGVLEAGAFLDQELPAIDRLLELNVASLVRLCHRFAPRMVERGEGRILNVASLGAFQPVPGLAVYAATKAFVLSFTEALSEELRGTGVTVTALCPGITDTDMVSRARDEVRFGPLPPGLVATPRSVALAGYRACLAGRVVEVPGIANEVVANWVRFQPRWLVRGVGGLLGRTLFRDL